MRIAKHTLAHLAIISLTFTMDKHTTSSAVIGGGCFWCLEAIFERIEGVTDVESGYAGGDTDDPSYKEVCSGTTGHAEVVRVAYDPDKISYSDLITIFLNTHDPTTPNRQGNDIGTQYRSIILFADEDEQKIAMSLIAQMDLDNTYGSKIVTELEPLRRFFPAEISHQDYYRNNPQAPYCNFVIKPKLDKARKLYKNIK